MQLGEKEIVEELSRLGINSQVERALYLNEYVEYTSCYNDSPANIFTFTLKNMKNRLFDYFLSR